MGQGPGRTNQKTRTRSAIVEAARRLRAANRPLTLAEVANAAKVSRATAYRYFPTVETLQVELEADAINAPIDRMVSRLASKDAVQRLTALVDGYYDLARRNEVHMRAALRAYQDTWLRGHKDGDAPPVRRGRRMAWISAVLEPLAEMSPRQLARLKAALALTVGADSFVILRDVAGADHAAAKDALEWAAVALLRAAVDEGGAGPRSRARGRGVRQTP